MPGKNICKRTVTVDKERGAPMNIEDIEQFCRTARREGAKSDSIVLVNDARDPGHFSGMEVAVHIEAEPVPEAAQPTAGGGPVGRYVGLDRPDRGDPVFKDSGPAGSGCAAPM